MRTSRRVVTFVFGALLLLGAVLALTVDMFSVGTSDVISCHVATSDSVYGGSTWSWLPPGKVCHYPDGSTERPHWRGELVALIAIPLSAVVALRALARLGLAATDSSAGQPLTRHVTDARAP